jgi:hypothetical protein
MKLVIVAVAQAAYGQVDTYLRSGNAGGFAVHGVGKEARDLLAGWEDALHDAGQAGSALLHTWRAIHDRFHEHFADNENSLQIPANKPRLNLLRPVLAAVSINADDKP